MAVMKRNMALMKGNIAQRHFRNGYNRCQIKNDQPGPHDFWGFLRQFEPIFLKFCIKILTAVKNSQNYIYYFKSYTICHVMKFYN